MDGQCGTSGRGACSGDGHSTAYVGTVLVTALLAAVVLVPQIWRLAGSVVGWYLRQKTEGRRQRLLRIMAADEQQFQEDSSKNRTAKKTGGGGGGGGSDSDWENVDDSSAISATNDDKGETDWEGIVGFFHPFW